MYLILCVNLLILIITLVTADEKVTPVEGRVVIPDGKKGKASRV